MPLAKKKPGLITDRAKRYRARKNPPPAPKICYCCGRPNVNDVEHIDGSEANNEDHNLAWSCRSCNTAKGAYFAANGHGIRTKQYNPKTSRNPGAKTLGQYLTAVMSLKGQSDQMSLPDAISLIHQTSAADRSSFGREIWSRRRRRGATNPTKTAARKKRNGDEAEAAAALSEQFHGRAVKKITGYELRETYQDNLANLGRLLRLDVLLEDGSARQFEFNTNVRVMSTPNGRQIQFLGGKQNLKLDEKGKDLITVGLVGEIEYHTAKDFHDFEAVDYTHEFGEEGGTLPTLLYDAMNQRMLLAGGTYRVERPGIID